MALACPVSLGKGNKRKTQDRTGKCGLATATTLCGLLWSTCFPFERAGKYKGLGSVLVMLIYCGVYFVLQFFLYFLLSKAFNSFTTERSIFLYHLGSSSFFTAVVGFWAARATSPDSWVWFTIVVMLHGIYSLSFLELWALADDSYSLAILAAIERAGSASEADLIEKLSAIGARKQKSRVNDLTGLGLIRGPADGKMLFLTTTGRCLAFCTRILLFLTGVRRYG